MQKKLQPRNSRSLAFRLKVVSAAVVSALVVVHASAAGLGRLTVLSALGQPLRAEIELTAVSADEARNLQPKLASMEAFRQANIEFNPALQSLRFAIEQRGSRRFIQITTQQPISEPFVDVLLELNGASGRLVREYTFLLDPPELKTVQPAQTTQGVGVTAGAVAGNVADDAASNGTRSNPRELARSSEVGNGNRRAVPEPESPRPMAGPRAQVVPRTPKAAAAPVREAAPIAANAPNGNSPGTEYKVQNGDTLSKIANRKRPTGISLDQMLVALYRANPDAFVGSNMYRLRAGQILAVPNPETSASVAAPEATGIVIAQAADFNEYRNKLAGQVAAAPARKAPESRQSASGKIAAKVEERPTAANEAIDKLKLSKADPAAAGKSASAQEDRVARDKASAESAARVKDLEKNVNDLQKLLDVKSRDLAERQKNAAATATAAAPAAAPASAKNAAMPADATPAANPAASTAATVVAPSAPAAPAAGVAPAAVPVAAQPATAVVVTTPVAAAREALNKAKAESPKADLPIKPKAAPEKAEPGLLDDPLGNPLVQGGAVLLALLLGGLAFMRAKGKKKSKSFTDTSIPDSSLKANSLFGSTGGQSVDTNNSVFNSSFAPATSNLDSNEVDPVAEADVYIAYGRDVQAEEILKEALRTQPDRHAVRVKLLEIYAARKDTRAFESLATELYSMSKGVGDDWAQAAAMGLALDPVNPLYANGKIIPTPADAPAAEAAKPAEDTAELDAFLDEVSGAHPFANTQADPKIDSKGDAKVDAGTGTTAGAGTAAPAGSAQPHGADGLGMALPFAAAAGAAVIAAHASHTDHATPEQAQPHAALHAPDIDLPTISTAPERATDAHASDNSLDFDLDGLSFETTDKPPVAPDGMPNAAKPGDDTALSALDFDFLHEDPAAAPAVAPAAETAPDHQSTPVSAAMTADFGGFDLPSTAAPHAVLSTPGLNPPPAADLQPSSFDAPFAPATPSAPQPLEFDLSGITLDLPESQPAFAPEAQVFSLDMPGGATDLPARRFDGAGSIGSIGKIGSAGKMGSLQDDFTELDLTTVAEHDDGASLGGISNNAEMATKLDLAVAYQEIGDQEGARELLDEVVKGGSAPQSEKARSLLARLG